MCEGFALLLVSPSPKVQVYSSTSSTKLANFTWQGALQLLLVVVKSGEGVAAGSLVSLSASWQLLSKAAEPITAKIKTSRKPFIYMSLFGISKV